MGPLFSAAVAVSGLLALAVLAYSVALARHGWRRAVPFAALFTTAFAASVAFAGALAALVLGVGPALESQASVIVYLAFLLGSGLVGGSLAWRKYAKRSNQLLKRTDSGGLRPPPSAA